MLTVGSLFAGIGGFDLGLERAGMRVLWQCEIDPYCQRVLAKHWPDVLRVPDIREVRRGVVPDVDVLCGGFPCQDLSYAGQGAGIDGARSGLWSEYARAIRELRPRYVIVENVAALLARGMGRVLGDLAACGYDAEWDCIPASAVGAPHRRDRVWLVAYPRGEQHQGAGDAVGRQATPRLLEAAPADSRHGREPQRSRSERREAREWSPVGSEPGCDGTARALADPSSTGRREGRIGPIREDQAGPSGGPSGRDPRPGMGDANGASAHALAAPGGSRGAVGEPSWWAVEPDVGRVAHGVPARVDRLRALGNALVPQIAEWLGRRIVDYEAQEGRIAA